MKSILNFILDKNRYQSFSSTMQILIVPLCHETITQPQLFARVFSTEVPAGIVTDNNNAWAQGPQKWHVSV